MGGELLRTDGKTHSELNTNLHSTLEVAVCQRLYCHQGLFIRSKAIPSPSVFVRGKMPTAILSPRIIHPWQRHSESVRVRPWQNANGDIVTKNYSSVAKTFRVSPCLSVAKCQLLYCHQELFIRGKDIPSQSVFVRGKMPTAILLPFFSRFLLLIPHIIRIFVAISTKRASARGTTCLSTTTVLHHENSL